MRPVHLGLSVAAGFLVLNMVIALCAQTYDRETGIQRPGKQRLLLYAGELLSWFVYFFAP